MSLLRNSRRPNLCHRLRSATVSASFTAGHLGVSADLFLEEREALGGERAGIESSSIGRLPDTIVGRSFDRTENQVRDEGGPLAARRHPTARHLASPDKHVELPTGGVLRRVREPGDTHRALRALQYTARPL